MIARVTIEWYRMLRKVDVPLCPLTVLIGQNNTGKSSFLRALGSVQSGIVHADCWRSVQAPTISIYRRKPDNNEESFSWTFEKQDSMRHSGVEELLNFANNHQFFELPRTGPAMSGAAVSDAAGPPRLGPDGLNLAALLDHLQRRDRKRFDAYVASARRLVPGLLDVSLVANSPEIRSIHLHIEGNHDLDANRASAGVRALLFFLALASHPLPPSLVTIEEPETGLHPQRLGEVVSLLRALTRGEYGASPTQVILSTHSPYLLDHVDLTSDQVLVFRRGQEGEALVEPASPERLRAFLGEFVLGEVWYNEGEVGLIPKESAGTPPAPP